MMMSAAPYTSPTANFSAKNSSPPAENPAGSLSSASPSAPGSTVRFATEEDIPTILSLIHDLATYEKEPATTVLATETSLLQTLSFPSNPTRGFARTLLIFPPPPSPSSPHTSKRSTSSTSSASASASVSSPPCAGFALFYTSYSTWRGAPGIYLEDLFVRPEFRGRGFGKRLLGELARETIRIGGQRLEWSVLKWNEPSIRFYEQGVGARQMDEWVGMRVDDVGDGLKRLAGVGRGVDGGEWEDERGE